MMFTVVVMQKYDAGVTINNQTNLSSTLQLVRLATLTQLLKPRINIRSLRQFSLTHSNIDIIP